MLKGERGGWMPLIFDAILKRPHASPTEQTPQTHVYPPIPSPILETKPQPDQPKRESLKVAKHYGTSSVGSHRKRRGNNHHAKIGARTTRRSKLLPPPPVLPTLFSKIRDLTCAFLDQPHTHTPPNSPCFPVPTHPFTLPRPRHCYNGRLGRRPPGKPPPTPTHGPANPVETHSRQRGVHELTLA